MYCGKVASALYKKELLWIDDFAEVLQFVRWGRNNLQEKKCVQFIQIGEKFQA